VRLRSLLLLAAASLAAFPAGAIVRRADRDDGEYLELATRYRSALALGGFGEGVLIAPRWILTSASVAAALREAHASRLAIAGAAHEIRSLFIAPPALDAGLALILLADDVPGIEPTPLHRERDEQGKAVVVVGHGATGFIGVHADVRDGRARGAINTIDRVEPTRLDLRIKANDDASDLQGAAAAGDEGAPAYLESKGRLSVAGIAIGPRGAAVPKVGDSDRYARVSAFTGWIDEAMFKAAADEASAATAKEKKKAPRGKHRAR
jgi:hypothetical protein